jgi:hypothetical protein
MFRRANLIQLSQSNQSFQRRPPFQIGRCVNLIADHPLWINPLYGVVWRILGRLDHVTGRRVSALLARPAFIALPQVPDRRIARSPDSIKQDAGLGLAAMAFKL